MKRFYFLFVCTVILLSAAAHNLTDAKWIGLPSDKQPLYSDYLAVFKLDFDIEINERSSVSLLYGLNDPRLMNPGMNVYQISSDSGDSYIKIHIDEGGIIEIFRHGYHESDSHELPMITFQKSKSWLQGINHISITSNLGYTTIYVNGDKAGDAGLNPIGNGGEYTAFPVLSEMGVEITGNAAVCNLSVSNYREPHGTLFSLPERLTHSRPIKLPKRAMPMLRTQFAVDPTRVLLSASIDITSRGIYDLTVNNARVTNEYFYPGATQYNKTHLYQTFDITPHIVTDSTNTVNVQLGEGWWSGPATYMGEYWNFYGSQQALLSAIRLDYADGTTDYILSSPDTWQYSPDSPVITGSFFNGEVYDSNHRCDEAQWFKAVEVPIESSSYPFPEGWDSVKLSSDNNVGVHAVDTLTSVCVSEPRKGVYVYDFGQNFAGIPLLSLRGLTPGTEVTMRYAEVLYPDMERYNTNQGMIMLENIRAAMNTDRYIVSGLDECEIFSPRFTFHGFRYLEITGLDQPLPLNHVKAIVLSSIEHFTAHYECSDSLVNRLWENIKWSTRSNFISIPTDCPQRNERLGWMGDISVFAPSATKLAHIPNLLKRYMQSVRDCQDDNGRFPDIAPMNVGFGGMLWGSAGITIPYQLVKQYGDTSVVQEHYQAMKRYIDYICHHDIDKDTGIIVQNHAWGDLADWLSPVYNRDDKSLLWECYFIYDLELMSQYADMLGYTDDKAYYDNLTASRRQFFADTYIDPVTYKTRFSAFDPVRQGEDVDTQASYALPIAMGIIDNSAFNNNFIATITRTTIADDSTECPPYSLMTGFIGTAWISEALSRIGRYDLAYLMLTNTEYPSWLYPVTQGATTVWERLNSYTHRDGFGKNNSMNSFNHYSFGSVANWLLTRSLGIDYTSARLTIVPEPDMTRRLTYARGGYKTPAGYVKSGWRIDNNNNNNIIIIYTLDVPVTTLFKGHDNHELLLPAGHHELTIPFDNIVSDK